MNQPHDGCFDILGNMYVSDTLNNRVLRFGNAIAVTPTSQVLPSFVNGTLLVLPGVTYETRGQTVTVAGDLVLRGTLLMNSSMFVSGSALLASGSVLNVSSTSVLAIGSTLNIEDGCFFTPVLTERPTTNAPVTFVFAQFGSLSGTVQNLKVSTRALTTYENAECTDLGSPAVTSSSTTLSVTVAVTQKCGAGLSSGALAGIIVGAVIGGIVLAIAIFLFSRFLIQRRTRNYNKALHTKAAAEMTSTQ